jgi:hypothetical protein
MDRVFPINISYQNGNNVEAAEETLRTGVNELSAQNLQQLSTRPDVQRHERQKQLKFNKKFKAEPGGGIAEKGLNIHNINHSSGLSSKHVTSQSKIECMTNDNSLKAEPSRDAAKNLDGKISSVPGF